MAAENVNTDLGADVVQNGWANIGPRMGLIETIIDLDDVSYSEANDWISVFTFDTPTVVFAAGVEVLTASTGACNIVLGTEADTDGLLTATAIGTAGTPTQAAGALSRVHFAADAVLAMGFSASPAGGRVRVWAAVMDPASLVTG